MKKIYLLFSLTILVTFLIGCWDYREIEDIIIVNTITLDKDENTEEYILNAEVIDVKGSGTGIELETLIAETRGTTIVDAVRNMIAITTKIPYWGHVTTIILSQDIVREDIVPILDWIARSPELKLTLRIFVSKEKTAKEILYREPEFTKIRTFEYEGVIRSFRYLSKLPDIKANKVINEVQSKEMTTVLPTVEKVNLQGKTTDHFIGSVYLDEGKLAGFLDPIDTMKYLFVINQIKGGVLIIPTGEENESKVTLDIYRSYTDIDIKLIDDLISISVNIKPIVNISEIEGEIDYTTKEGRRILKEKADMYLENEIQSFIKGIQKNQGIDIFNFGNKLSKRHPSIWRKIGNNWDKIFRELKVEVNSDIRIKSSQHITTPIGVDID